MSSSRNPRRVLPLDYERELTSRTSDIKKEKHLNLLLFPQQDVTVKQEGSKHRTETFPVTDDELFQSMQLFTKDCLHFYGSQWERVKYTYSKYGHGYSSLMDEEERESLPHLTFERDQVEAERVQQEEVDHSKRTVSKSGYLLKGPFPNDSGFGLSIKNYRKRWFELKGGPAYGGYTLVYYRDDKSSTVKGKIYLETCTDIRPNSKNRTFGFDLLTEDDKVFYPLATETQSDMEDWLLTLGKAIGLIEEDEPVNPSKYRAAYTQDTLRDMTKKTLHKPDLLLWKEKQNKEQQTDRNNLFLVYPEIMHHSSVEDVVSLTTPPPPFKEVLGLQVKVICQSLSLKLTLSRHGKQELLEPFYVTLALFDAQKGLKISEDFHVMFNPSESPPTGDTLTQLIKSIDQGIFSVTFPHPEVYLVARIEKILQGGGISTCTEPYMKHIDTSQKSFQKLSGQISLACEKLGSYSMPFAWAAKPLFVNENEVNRLHEMSPLFRQEKERLTDNDLLKMLADYKNIGRYKLQVIPGSIQLVTQPFVPTGGSNNLILTPTYDALKGHSNTSAPQAAMLEVREFPPLEAYNSYSKCQPNISLTNHMYLYPLLLKYDTQKQFTKARNIAVCVQLRDNDTSDSKPLKVLYDSLDNGQLLTDTVSAPVLYHSSTPTFYKEVKISLPTRISRRHHILFIFKHVSCDSVKPSSKGSTRGASLRGSLETIVGYSWCPILQSDGRVCSGVQQLPVACNLPSGYLGLLRTDLRKKDTSLSDIKWVMDSTKLLFTVKLFPDTTLYTEVSEIFTFFAICDHISSGKDVPFEDLKFAVESLRDLELQSLKCLPILLNRMFILICQSFEPVEEVKINMIKVLVGIVEEVTLMDRKDLLKSYIEYAFVTSTDAITSVSVHDELIRLLLEYITNTNTSIEGEDEGQDKLLKHIWFFFDIVLKSMAQYLNHKGQEGAPRRNRFSDEFAENLQELLSHLTAKICSEKETSGEQEATISIANFLKQSFSCMDRGIVFSIIDLCLDQFDLSEKQSAAELRLEFISVLCQYEHFIPLNLPFETKPVLTPFYLTDGYCTNHYLLGLVLKELELALKSKNVPVRSKAIEVVRNLCAKIDCDDRFVDQKSRIATLFFPIITVIVLNSSKLYKGDREEMVSPSDKQTNICSDMTSEVATPPQTPFVDESFPVSKKSLLSSDITSISSSEGIILTKKSSVLSMSNGGPPPPSIRKQQPSLIEVINPLDASSNSLVLSNGGDSGDEQSLNDTTLQENGNKELEDEEQLSYKETRDLLMCFLFVLKDVDSEVLFQWWQHCVDAPVSLARKFSISNRLEDTQPAGVNEQIELMSFFDVMQCCVRIFQYPGRLAITKKWSARTNILKQLERMYIKDHPTASIASRKSHVGSYSLISGGGARGGARFSMNYSSIRSSTEALLEQGGGEDEVEVYVSVEGTLANEMGLTVLSTLEHFGNKFKELLNEYDDNTSLNKKFFSLLVKLLEANPSTALCHNIFNTIKGFTHEFADVLFKGSSEHCSALCYQLLKCCNSNITQIKTEAIAVLYMLMKVNFQFSKQKSFVRTGLQTTVALSRIATSSIALSYTNLRKSLAVIVVYADNDERVKSTTFPSEVRQLMIRLRTVLSSTAQMKEHSTDPEKLLDLYYSLADSYAHSPELRHTWLESMADRHIQYGNYSEAAQCYLHSAGLIAEYLRLTGRYSQGCSVLGNISNNIKHVEGNIKLDEREGHEQRYSESDLVQALEQALTQLEKAELYELMTPVFKILLPYYEANKNYKTLMEVYGRLYEAHKKIVTVMSTGQRFLGTYYRVGFYGELFGEDHCHEFVYREPKLTSLPELTIRLETMYSKKFGPNSVQMIHDSAKVDVSSLDPDKGYIQVTHVTPYFTEDELLQRNTQFERDSNINRFVFETPFTESGKAHGTVESQCMRKTILTTSRWFPYIIKRIPVKDTEIKEISPIEVAIEAMEKQGRDLAIEIEKEKTDLVKLQLLLQGSISAQVNQGVQEYANVFLKDIQKSQKYVRKFIDHLKEVYRMFLNLCERALQLHGQLISKEQQLLQNEMMHQFQAMKLLLAPILDPTSRKRLATTHSVTSLPSQPVRRQVIGGKRGQIARAATVVIPSPTTI